MENPNQAQPVKPNQRPQGMIVDIHIRWENGNVKLDAPTNPLIVMKVLADAMSVYALQTGQMIQKENQSSIIKPNGAFVDKELMKKASQE